MKKIFEIIGKAKFWMTLFCAIFAAGLIFKWFVKQDITTADLGVLVGYIFAGIGGMTYTKKIKNGNGQ